MLLTKKPMKSSHRVSNSPEIRAVEKQLEIGSRPFMSRPPMASHLLPKFNTDQKDQSSNTQRNQQQKPLFKDVNSLQQLSQDDVD